MKRTKKLLRLTGVCQKIGNCSKATVWRRVADGTLPKPAKIGGLTVWVEDEIDAAIESALAERDEAAA
jgi:predicted DNA-binding transcriptional regulator AlpA